MKAKLFVTLAVLAAAGYGGYTYFNKPPKLTFLKAQVTRGTVEAVISATGTLSATRLVPVGSRVSGNVVKMYADFNTVVKKGDLLAEIDPSTFQNTMEQRQAALRSAQTQILQAQVAERKADVDVRNAETAVANAKIAVARAKSQMDQAKRKYDQQKGLGDVTSKDAIDTARETYEQAQLSLESAEASLATTQGQLEATKAQREVTLTQKITAESQIVQAQGQLTDADLNLSFTKITSPVDGVVITRKLNEGETVQASMTAPQLYEIAEDLTEMHLDTNIDESDISRVQIGQQASFAVDAFPGQQFRGEVIQIRRGAVNVQNVISYTVVISVDNSDLRLFPGMTANTRIIVDRVENALRIPSSALRFRPPAELTVVGDTLKGGKGGRNGGKDGGKDATPSDSKDSKDAVPAPQPLPETSKVAEPSKQGKETRTAKADFGKGGNGGDGNGGQGKRNRGDGSGGGNGKGGFDPSQFRGKDGQIDREALRAAFQAKGGGGGGNVDPSQFQGRGGNGGGANGDGGNGRGGNAGGGNGRGGNGGNRTAAAFPAGPGSGRGRGQGIQQQSQIVYRLNAKNEVEGVRIRTGLSDGNWIQLLSNNLEEGAELITAVDGLPTANKANNNNQFPGGNNKGNNFPGGGFPGGGGGGRPF